MNPDYLNIAYVMWHMYQEVVESSKYYQCYKCTCKVMLLVAGCSGNVYQTAAA